MQEQLKRGRIEHQQDFEVRAKARLAKIQEADPTAVRLEGGVDPAIVTIAGDNHWPMEPAAPSYTSHFVPGSSRFAPNSQDEIRALGHTFRKMQPSDYLGYDGIERGSYMCEIESPNGPEDPNGYTTLFLYPDGSIFEQEAVDRPGYLEGYYTRHWKFDDRWTSPMPEPELLADRVLILMPLEEGNVARSMIGISGVSTSVFEEVFNLELDEPCLVPEGFQCPLGETTVDDFGRPLCYVPAEVLTPILANAGNVIAQVSGFLVETFNRPVVVYWATQERQATESAPPDCKTDIEVQLSGNDGNAFSIMARVSSALRKGGRRDLVASFQTEATNGDYDNLLTTCMRYVRVS